MGWLTSLLEPVLDPLIGWFTDVTPEGRAFDATWGTNTRGFDLGNYEPCRPDVVEAALDALDLGPDGVTFVDLGSGKGRVALLASQRAWLRVVGIEHRSVLHDLAQRNLAAFEGRGGCRCPVVLLQADIADQALPDGPLVLFLYNSFPPRVLRPFVAGLPGRELRLIYVNPQHADVVEAAGFRVIAEHDGGSDRFWAWRIYAPAGTAGATRERSARGDAPGGTPRSGST